MRKTRQRVAILTALRASERPLTPQEILEKASEEVQDVNLTTIYRNLKLLVGGGEVVAIEVPGQPPRYEQAGAPHHHHFLCVACDRMFDVPGCPGSLEQHAPKGFQVTGHTLQLTGRCAACR